jgi:carbon-monoxide dehydrogenase medium subunit
MKPSRFDYHVPSNPSGAVALLRDLGPEAKILAGGQSLMPLLNFRMAQPRHLIDLNRIPELAYIAERDGGVALGAMTRQRVAERSPLVGDRCPLLAAALPSIGHIQIRSRGTIGGSVAHADPASELPAVLAALGGCVTLLGPSGSRRVSPDEFFVTYLTTSAGPDEVLTEVWFPSPLPHTGHAWLEVAYRHGDYALVGVAAVLTLDVDGTITDCRLALAGVGATPMRVPAAEERLLGDKPDPALFREAARLVMRDIEPSTDVHATADYRRHLAGILTTRGLEQAAQVVREEENGARRGT